VLAEVPKFTLGLGHEITRLYRPKVFSHNVSSCQYIGKVKDDYTAANLVLYLLHWITVLEMAVLLSERLVHEAIHGLCAGRNPINSRCLTKDLFEVPFDAIRERNERVLTKVCIVSL
jgi:hypothetical protein